MALSAMDNSATRVFAGWFDRMVDGTLPDDDLRFLIDECGGEALEDQGYALNFAIESLVYGNTDLPPDQRSENNLIWELLSTVLDDVNWSRVAEYLRDASTRISSEKEAGK